jgi:hypothetical protein
LTSVNLPSGLAEVEEYTFGACYKLKDLVISEGVKCIKANAFNTCMDLEKLIIPASVTEIDLYAFYGSDGLTSIEVKDGNPNYESIGNGLYTKDGSTLIIYANGTDTTTVTIAAGTKHVNDYAFSGNYKLETITIPKSMVSLGKRILFGCNHLKEIIYDGTQTEWETITKDPEWDYYSGLYGYTIKCSDGNIVVKK